MEDGEMEECMALLSRDDVLGAGELRTRDVDCPEWGGTIRVREMTGAERDEFEQIALRVQEGMKVKDYRALLASWCAIDEEGNQLFKPGDVQKLSGMSSRPLDRIMDVVTELSEIGPEAKKRARANFLKGQSDDSTSD